ncbi:MULTISPECIES: XdhC family protein [unclassified Nocardia]|uniref:XdhC family protein n=1 Tax=unclassified Nocardia TaxID=2637762 RepID=UPI00278C8F02|nr:MULTISPECIES: XdhC/CoxI family protein [unclassified Nocardia]
MLDLLDRLHDWHTGGMRAALATVVDTSLSAPRAPGAAMAVSESFEVVGSISGGCVEAATVALAETVLASGIPIREHFGVTDDDALSVGLTCGGTIDVYVEPVTDALLEHLRGIRRALRERRSVTVATVMPDGGLPARFRCEDGTIIGPKTALPHWLPPLLSAERDELIRVDSGTVFIQIFTPVPRLIIFGAVDFASALARLAKPLGYHVTICDARPLFTTPERFPEADEVVVDWPHRYLDTIEPDHHTALCVMTHDPKFDLPLLERALQRPAAYIGAMGSRRASADRMNALRARGITPTQLRRLHAPIGLDIGAATPAETAVSILAEILAARAQRSGRPLTTGTGAIHARHHRHEAIPPHTVDAAPGGHPAPQGS